MTERKRLVISTFATAAAIAALLVGPGAVGNAASSDAPVPPGLSGP